MGGEFFEGGLEEERKLDAFVVKVGEPAFLRGERPIEDVGFVGSAPAGGNFSEALEKVKLANGIFVGKEGFDEAGHGEGVAIKSEEARAFPGNLWIVGGDGADEGD